MVIGVGSVGVDMVDIEAATEASIVVTNVPDVFIEEVADHAMMLLACGRRMKTMAQMAADGRWWSGRPLLNHVPRLMGQTLGLYAFGNVARCTARRAKAFGMHVIAYDPYVSELTVSEAGVEPVSAQELFEQSDYLSLHAPHNAETHHAVNADTLAMMQPHAVIINTARGPLIDEQALVKALNNQKIAAAGLDVLEQEPPAKDNPLLAMDTLISPHVASGEHAHASGNPIYGREVALVLRNNGLSCVNSTVLPEHHQSVGNPPMNRGQIAIIAVLVQGWMR